MCKTFVFAIFILNNIGLFVETIKTIYINLPYILEGTYTTVLLILGALALGFCLGVPLAILQVYGNRFIRQIVALYVWFFRGVPILLLLFLFYFGLFNLIGLNLNALTASGLVLGLTSSAYQSQIFRGSIQSLPLGQFKAGSALGMTNFQIIKNIILPQALRLSIPGWSNEYSILLKDSTLCFAVGASEIMARTHFVASRTYEYLPLYIVAGFLYFLITLIGIRILRFIEKKYAIPGYTLSV